MKTFKRLLSEVAQPKAGDEKEFKKKHKIEIIDEPNAEEVQFSGGTKKTPPRRADYTGGKDEDVYEEAEIIFNHETGLYEDVDQLNETYSDSDLTNLSDELNLPVKTEFNFGPLAHKGHRIGFVGKPMKTFKTNDEAAKHLLDLHKKIRDRHAAKALKNEDVDQLDEISKKLAYRAADKAETRMGKATKDADKLYRKTGGDVTLPKFDEFENTYRKAKAQRAKFLKYAYKKEDADTLHEVFSAGIVKLSDGSKLTVTSEDASILNTLYKNLGGSSQSAMYNNALSNKKNFGELLSFAKTTVGDK